MVLRLMARLRNRLVAELRNLTGVLVHGLAGVLVGLLVEGEASAALVVMAFVTANLADIDTAYSHIGRLVYPLARWLEAHCGHRTLTHSLLAVAGVAGAAAGADALGFAPWPWWLWPVWYAVHLLIDMVVGGRTGVPLLWPSPLRFYLLEVEPGGLGERLIGLGLALGVAVLWLDVGVTPSRILHEQAGTLAFALQDYREWEAFYTVYADIEGTWQADRTPIEGRFEVVRVSGHTFVLRGGGRTFSAGQADQEVYLRRIVAGRGPARAPLSPTPTPSATPVTVTVRIDNVHDPQREIRVVVGQRVERGQVLADLAGYRQQLAASLPTPTPPPTPTPTPEPFLLEQAQAQLWLARAQATAVVWVEDEAVAGAAAQLALAEREVQQARARYDAVAWRPNVGMLPESLALERATGAHQVAIARATLAARGPSAAERAVARARLQGAEIEYRRAVARLTPVASPTVAPVSPPAPAGAVARFAEQTVIRSLLTGSVGEIRVAAVRGNVAVVEIAIVQAHPAAFHPVGQPGQTGSAAGQIRALLRRWHTATVSGHGAGNTLEVRLASSGKASVFAPIAEEDVLGVQLAGVRGEGPELANQGAACDRPGGAAYLRLLLPAGSTVILEAAVEMGVDGEEALAYVWLPDGRLLNERLVAGGHARVVAGGSDTRYQGRLQNAEQAARRAGRGVWGICPWPSPVTQAPL